jgi:hypothetical protein
MYCSLCDQRFGQANLFRTGPHGLYSLFAMGTASEALCPTCAIRKLEEGQRLYAREIPSLPLIVAAVAALLLLPSPLFAGLGLSVRVRAVLGGLAFLAAIGSPSLIPPCRVWRPASVDATGPGPLQDPWGLLAWVTENVRAGVPDREIKRSRELEPVTSFEAELLLWAAKRQPPPSPQA